VETNGSRDISVVDPRCVRIVDLKCPSSGEAESNDYGNLDRLGSRDELKFVMADREDFEFARRIVQDFGGRAGRLAVPVHFSPVFGRLEPGTLARWILGDRLRVRLNLQLHKVIWGPDERGV
jgi:7-carboxy-7-deazaguanine synthase